MDDQLCTGCGQPTDRCACGQFRAFLQSELKWVEQCFGHAEARTLSANRIQLGQYKLQLLKELENSG